MNILRSSLWICDLDETIGSMSELSELEGKRILVTGCTGLICSAIVDVFIRWNQVHEEKILICAAGRSYKKIKERFEPYSREEWFEIVKYDASSTDNDMGFACDYIIHGASNASPDKIVKEPVETMLSNFLGTKYLLDYAKDHSSERVLFISSSEVYGNKMGDYPFHADEYGYIDLLNPRNSYSVGKRAAETLCASYSDEYGVETVIVRPGHIYGPTASPDDRRVSSAWAYSCAEDRDIVMKSEGKQIRSYCYCLDCASAIIKVMIKGENSKAYNISNPESIISIRKMAEILADSSDGRLRYEPPTSAERKGFNPMSNSSLDSTELCALGWNGLFDAKRGFSHTVQILKEILKQQ